MMAALRYCIRKTSSCVVPLLSLLALIVTTAFIASSRREPAAFPRASKITGVLQTGTRVLQTGTGVLQTGTGVLQTGTRVLQTGTGVLQTGTGVLQTGTGVLQTGTGVLQTGTGVLQTVDIIADTNSTAKILKPDEANATAEKLLDGFSKRTGFKPFPSLMSEEESLESMCNTMADVANANMSSVLIQDGKAMYSVGDQISVNIVLRNRNGVRKVRGGAILKIAIVNDSDGSYTPGRIIDNGNGSYSGVVDVLWPGQAYLVVRLVYTRESITAIYRSRRKALSTKNILAEFNFKNWTELTICHPVAEHLQKFTPPHRSLCNFTRINSDKPWLCQKPTNPSLTCGHWTHSRSGEGDPKITMVEDNIIRYPMALCRKRITVGGEMKNLASHFHRSCFNSSPPALWKQTQPTGFFYKRKWVLRTCSETPKRRYFDCLKNKDIYLLGDSTMRQWLTLDMTTRFNLTIPPKAEATKARIIRGINSDLNLTVIYYSRNHPMFAYHVWTEQATYSITKVIDGIRDNDASIVVVNIDVHLTAFIAEAFMDEIVYIKASIDKLLARNSRVRVLIKAPHSYPGNPVFSDFYSYVYINIIYDVFKDIQHRVIFMNAMDATDAIDNRDIHPSGMIVGAMVEQMLSFICP